MGHGTSRPSYMDVDDGEDRARASQPRPAPQRQHSQQRAHPGPQSGHPAAANNNSFGSPGRAGQMHHPGASHQMPHSGAPQVVLCPRCNTLLVPPAPLFQCPNCHQTMRAPAPQMPPARAAAMSIEYRIHEEIRRRGRGDPGSRYLQQLLVDARQPDGSLDVSRIRQVQEHMLRLENGASEATIAALPTRVFSLSSLPIDADEERRTCTICLSEYADGDVLRTLPCLHSFHRDCVDRWLRDQKTCVTCKIPIDVNPASFGIDVPMDEDMDGASPPPALPPHQAAPRPMAAAHAPVPPPRAASHGHSHSNPFASHATFVVPPPGIQRGGPFSPPDAAPGGASHAGPHPGPQQQQQHNPFAPRAQQQSPETRGSPSQTGMYPAFDDFRPHGS